MFQGLLGYLGDVTKVTCLGTFSLEAGSGVETLLREQGVMCTWGRGGLGRGMVDGLVGVNRDGVLAAASLCAGNVSKCLEPSKCLILGRFLQTKGQGRQRACVQSVRALLLAGNALYCSLRLELL